MNKLIEIVRQEVAKLSGIMNSQASIKEKALSIFKNKIVVSVTCLTALIVIAIGGFSSSSNSRFVSLVKNGVLSIDQAVTVGNAFENYKYFKTTKWKEFEDQQKRRVVQFNGNLDLKMLSKEVLDKKYDKSILSQLPGHPELEKTGEVTVQFLINNDNESFKLAYCELEIGKRKSTKIDDVIIPIYKNAMMDEAKWAIEKVYQADAQQLYDKSYAEKKPQVSRQYIANSHDKIVGKYTTDSVPCKKGALILTVKDISESSAKTELSIKGDDGSTSTYDLNFSLSPVAFSEEELLGGHFSLRGKVTNSKVPGAANEIRFEYNNSKQMIELSGLPGCGGGFFYKD